MNIEDWWPDLDAATQEWLINNNGDDVPAEILNRIADAGGVIGPDSPWLGESGPEGFFLSDDAVDWIEAVGNGEEPDGR